MIVFVAIQRICQEIEHMFFVRLHPVQMLKGNIR